MTHVAFVVFAAAKFVRNASRKLAAGNSRDGAMLVFLASAPRETPQDIGAMVSEIVGQAADITLHENILSSAYFLRQRGRTPRADSLTCSSISA